MNSNNLNKSSVLKLFFILLLLVPFYSNAQWTQKGLDIDGETADDRSGWSVSMNSTGDRLAIGAIYNSGSGSNSGHVRVYEWNGTAWTQKGIDIDGEAAQDWSGKSVSINGVGDRLAIGAPWNDGNATRAGHVRVYEWNTMAWTQMGPDLDGDSTGDISGWSVSMSSLGDRLTIGIPSNAVNVNNSGYVSAHQYNLTTGIYEIENDNSFSIYPNPVSENLNIESSNSIGYIAQITSITGTILLEFKVTQEKETIDLSAFQNGLYFLKVGNQTRKIIVAR